MLGCSLWVLASTLYFYYHYSVIYRLLLLLFPFCRPGSLICIVFVTLPHWCGSHRPAMSVQRTGPRTRTRCRRKRRRQQWRRRRKRTRRSFRRRSTRRRRWTRTSPPAPLRRACAALSLLISRAAFSGCCASEPPGRVQCRYAGAGAARVPEAQGAPAWRVGAGLSLRRCQTKLVSHALARMVRILAVPARRRRPRRQARQRTRGCGRRAHLARVAAGGGRDAETEARLASPHLGVPRWERTPPASRGRTLP
jgi:hypothetical protein